MPPPLLPFTLNHYLLLTSSSPSHPHSKQTKSEKYLIENTAASDVELTPAEVAELREIIEANKPVGDRYAEGEMARVSQ
jgi:hypothetical protein